MPYYYMDYSYIILVIPCMLFAMWAQYSVNSTFNRYSKVYSRRGITGAQAAAAVLRFNNVTNVQVMHISGHLNDHFDPRDNIIRLSDSVYSSTSVAAIGVAAHEAGHAVQYAYGYVPMKMRSAIIPVTQLGSALAMPMILVGFIFNFSTLALIGVLFFGTSTAFQLITLPVELNASNRALDSIRQSGLLDDDEYPCAKKTLTAAAMTYVAALAVSAAQFLRLLIMVMGRNGRNRR